VKYKDKGDSKHPHHAEIDPDKEDLKNGKEHDGFEYGILKKKDADEYDLPEKHIGRVRYGRARLGTLPANTEREVENKAVKLIDKKLYEIDDAPNKVYGKTEEQLKRSGHVMEVKELVPKRLIHKLDEDPFQALVRLGKIKRLKKPPKGHIYV